MAQLSIEIVEGAGTGRRVPLDGSVEVGRSSSVTFTLDDDLASRQHARISIQEGRAVVQDLDSLNGTFVNGEQIHAPTPLQPGDQIIVGATVLQLRSAEQVAAQPSAAHPVPAGLAAPPALAIPPQKPDYVPPAAVREPSGHRLEPLLDVRTKAKARTAPLAVFVLAALVVMLYLATR